MSCLTAKGRYADFVSMAALALDRSHGDACEPSIEVSGRETSGESLQRRPTPDGLRPSAFRLHRYRTACALPLSGCTDTGRLAPFRFHVAQIPDGLRRSEAIFIAFFQGLPLSVARHYRAVSSRFNSELPPDGTVTFSSEVFTLPYLRGTR